MSIVLLNTQIEAPSEMTANEQEWTARGLPPTYKWQSERRMMPMNTRGDPVGNAQGLARGIPGVRRIRMPFNKNFFGRPEFPGMHPDLNAWLRELVRQGFRFVWCMMDGPSQEAGSGGEWAHYHLMYPGEWPETETLEQWRDWMQPGGRMSDRHIENFQALFDWLETCPDMIIDGFEAINEPASYQRPASRFGAQYEAEFLGYYVDHVERIYNFVQSRYPGKDFYIGGMGYSSKFSGFETVRLPSRNGQTALEVFRSLMPHGQSGQLVWSAHFYTTWFNTVYSHQEMRAELDGRWRMLFPDRIVVTETNFYDHLVDDWLLDHADKWRNWFMARVGDWYQDRGVGFAWFSAVNFGPNKLLTVAVDGEIYLEAQQMFAGFYNVACRVDRQGELVTVPRSGHQPLHRIAAVRGIRNSIYAPDAGTMDEAMHYTVGFGGLGVCVLTGHDDANNFLYGGPGRTILYGGALDDYLYLGIGGGVIRTGSGHSTCGTNGGENLIYTGPGEHLVTCIHGRSTIVCDPAGVTRIFGFNPSKGDRLSFKGAFGDGDQMRAASRGVPSLSTQGNTNVEITTPQGGKVILLHAGSTLDVVRFYVRDFMDGWYAAGWTEPADYSVAEFSLPMAAAPPVVMPGPAPDPADRAPRDHQGRRVIVRDAQRRFVQFWAA